MASVIGGAILRTQTDERLVALARTGHQRAFEAIAERYRPELTRSLRRLLPGSSVEDALQQTHLQAWKALAGGTEVRELRAWLHRIARNAALGIASRGYDYDELEDALQATGGPEQDLERREAVRRTLRGIAELPERQREALLAVAVGGRSHAEVALDLGITDAAARQLVRRARVSLLALTSLVIPPQVVRWAAHGGHSLAAGKAAAGTGLGGGLTGSVLKLGAVAVTIGGVAAGVAPLHPGSTAAPPAHHHRHHARAARTPVHLAAAVTLKAPSRPHPTSATPTVPPHPAVARHRSALHVRRVRPEAVGKTVSPLPAPTPTPASAPAPVAPTPAAAPATTPAPAATPTPAGAPSPLAVLAAWWTAYRAAHTATAGTQKTTDGPGPCAGPAPGAGSASGSTGCRPSPVSLGSGTGGSWAGREH
ncbi:MAG: hypothetical protein QOE44_2979 [Solirubrobacteraceae bacterium]|nr:hypothetical protein [Solirubrobacteraceae bacterium]